MTVPQRVDSLQISIITPTLNQATFIDDMIQSIHRQRYKNIEHIVVDGGSVDGTLDILKRNEDRLRWISERDSGQSNAINKGFRMATGDILCWLNSDDLYIGQSLEVVADYFLKHPTHEFVYGDALGLNRQGKSFGVRSHVRQTDLGMLVHESDFIVQPAAFWRKSLWEKVGELDETLAYTMDYEYWMRVAKVTPLYYIPVTLAAERMYGDAKTFKGSIKRLEEIEQVANRHGGQGMPRRFEPEAKATYLAEAVSFFLKGERRDAQRLFAKSRTYHAHPILFGGYMVAILVLGFNRLSSVRLHGNRLRRTFRRLKAKVNLTA
jgi:glycosyltransferase involved in cell wall biosynthesis